MGREEGGGTAGAFCPTLDSVHTEEAEHNVFQACYLSEKDLTRDDLSSELSFTCKG